MLLHEPELQFLRNDAATLQEGESGVLNTSHGGLLALLKRLGVARWTKSGKLALVQDRLQRLPQAVGTEPMRAFRGQSVLGGYRYAHLIVGVGMGIEEFIRSGIG